jgi:hypothetical protein
MKIRNIETWILQMKIHKDEAFCCRSQIFTKFGEKKLVFPDGLKKAKSALISAAFRGTAFFMVKLDRSAAKKFFALFEKRFRETFVIKIHYRDHPFNILGRGRHCRFFFQKDGARKGFSKRCLR